LFSHNFNCSGSSLQIVQTSQPVNKFACVIHLSIKIFEGPYRGGCYAFRLDVPENYPFNIVEVWALHPIWHPNIDLETGRVAINVDWCPVLTLNSVALAVQVSLFILILLSY
jgi:ubiquitin-protein ligase